MAYLIVWNEFPKMWSTVLCNASQSVDIQRDEVTIKSVGHSEPKQAVLEVIEERFRSFQFLQLF